MWSAAAPGFTVADKRRDPGNKNVAHFILEMILVVYAYADAEALKS